jgi:hypothetical protein
MLKWVNFPDNTSLNECAKELIIAFYNRRHPDIKIELNSIANKIDICKQSKNIDLYFSAHINDEKKVFLIEDKVDTTCHSGQLNRYKESLSKEYIDIEIIPIYLKTGYIYPSEEVLVKCDSYSIFTGKELLSILSKYADTNAILDDFRLNLLAKIEAEQYIIDDVLIADIPKFSSHISQIEYLKMFYKNLNILGHEYSNKHISHEPNRGSGSPFSVLNLLNKYIGSDECEETVLIRIDNNRKNPESKQYDYNFGLKQYCHINTNDDAKKKELKRLKLENLKRLKESLPRMDANSKLKIGKTWNDWSGKNESEICVLFFNGPNTPKRVLNDFPQIIDQFIRNLRAEPLSYVPVYSK